MANSRMSRDPAEHCDGDPDLYPQFERALGDILARVFAFVPATLPQAQALSMGGGKAEIDGKVGIAYSGGLDSSVLLHLAARYAARHGVALHAFHVHHGLSPNANAWLVHCETGAAGLGIPFEAVKVQVEGIERHGIEEAARIARYRALAEQCARHGIRLLLTGHHQDDQAETLMLQLLRGAGVRGLSGMADLHNDHALLGPRAALGRPLLAFSRSELEKIAIGQALAFVDDESNTDPAYRRNALRHEIFPSIERHFPGFAALMGRSAAHMQSAQVLLDQLAQTDLQACRADEEGRTLSISAMARLTPERMDNLLRHWLRAEGLLLPSTARIEEMRLQILEAGADRHPVFSFGQLALRRIGGRLEVASDLGDPPVKEFAFQWRGEDSIHVPQWRGMLIFRQASDEGLDPARLRAGTLSFRPRSGHERLKPIRNRPSRSLKNLYQEASVPAWRRQWLPLLYQGEDLLFAAGLGMDARHCVAGGVELRWEAE